MRMNVRVTLRFSHCSCSFWFSAVAPVAGGPADPPCSSVERSAAGIALPAFVAFSNFANRDSISMFVVLYCLTAPDAQVSVCEFRKRAY